MEPLTEETLREMVRVIVAETDPWRVILFGSRATGQARADSDVDLLVIERAPFGNGRSRRREAARLWRALARFRVPKDILVFSRDEAEAWRDVRNHVLARAQREGRVLYETA